ncbi:Protein of uncharacterised function (DUF1602) [Achromobacter aegrifaciens]|uniref:Protein of uncharacterized function (DUF1602) n=1 Tax=Achromobacter aegrifaciens TaxID=1287736 RepID=A0AAD2IW43_ACHAE|nr:Protein of uncharacterised function (DUF1602) [Achromobacter aegrifaciens]
MAPSIWFSRAARWRRPGIAFIRPCVYGWPGRRSTSSTGPISTMRPAYITATRSAVSAITPMSCVTNSTEVPCSRHKRRNSAVICACTDTSSAVVGSSAMMSAGRAARASAITTRWRMPPEN